MTADEEAGRRERTDLHSSSAQAVTSAWLGTVKILPGSEALVPFF